MTVAESVELAIKGGGFAILVYLFVQIIQAWREQDSARFKIDQEREEAFKQRDVALDNLMKQIDATHRETLAVQRQGFDTYVQTIRMITEEMRLTRKGAEDLAQAVKDNQAMIETIPARTNDVLKPQFQALHDLIEDIVTTSVTKILARVGAADLNVLNVEEHLTEVHNAVMVAFPTDGDSSS